MECNLNLKVFSLVCMTTELFKVVAYFMPFSNSTNRHDLTILKIESLVSKNIGNFSCGRKHSSCQRHYRTSNYKHLEISSKITKAFKQGKQKKS